MLRIPRVRRPAGFTLIELMIAMAILAIFLFIVYKLFIGGSQTANRAQWINGTVEEVRNTLTLLQKELKSTSYPTTLFANTILDSTGDPAKAAPFYVQIKQEGVAIKPPDDGAAPVEIMKWVVCEPEQPPNSGKITYNKLFLSGKMNTLTKVGDLIIQSEAFEFKTSGPDHAKAGESALSKTALPTNKRNKAIVHDVEFVKFMVPSSLPTEPTDFQPVKMIIQTRFPKDPKVFKENEIMVTPNVGISTF